MAFRISEGAKNTLIYGASLAALLILMQWLQLRFIIIDHAQDIYIGFIALIFTSLGIWLALKLVKPKKETLIVEKEVYITREVIVTAPPVEQPVMPPAQAQFATNEKQLQQSGISARELEVLQLMAKGLSNQEIAEQLFVSLNTIKTHSSNLFVKLDVKRRTQAVEQARKLGIIP